jgi:hypothetical protein
LRNQTLIHQARYTSRQLHPLVVAHRESTSYFVRLAAENTIETGNSGMQTAPARTLAHSREMAVPPIGIPESGRARPVNKPLGRWRERMSPRKQPNPRASHKSSRSPTETASRAQTMIGFPCL